MKLLFVVLLLAFTVATVQGQCNFDSTWTGRWWIKHWASGGMVYYDFKASQPNQVTMVLVNLAGQEQILETRTCRERQFSSPLWYHLIRYDTNVKNEDRCLEIFHASNILLTRESGAVTVPFSQCTSTIASIQNPKSQVLVKSPINMADTDCPFPDGSYQVKYAEQLSSEAFCDGIVTSSIVVNGNKLTIRTCSTKTYTYDTPYNVDMTCILAFSPNAIGSDSVNGDMLILSAKNADGNDVFYCARYKIESLAKKITMSISVNNPEETYCQPSATYETVSNSAFSKYRRFIMTPLYCLQGVCKNGATCEDSLGDYTCTCAPGWTGKNCDVDIDECASSPCLNNGQCINAENSFRCLCRPTHFGDTCQFLACNLPTTWQYTWWKEYEAPNSLTQNTITFSTNALTESEANTEKVWFCESDRQDSTFHYFSLKLQNSNPEQRKCAEGTVVGTTGDVMVFRASTPEVRSTVYTAAECVARLGDRREMDVLVTDPFLALAFRDCPWPNNNVRYQTQYYTIPGTANCVGDVDSKAFANGQITDVQSCYVGVESYRDPMFTELRCVDNWSATITDGSSGNGDYVLLAFQDPTVTNYMFYCAKYSIVDNKISISFDTSDSTNAKCYMNRGYTISSADERSFIWASNLCAEKPCLNGATCVDKMTATAASYECVCAAGFAGTLCDINIDDCAPRPCENNGQCIDGINSFTCTCTGDFYGDRCQFGACNLPATFRLPSTFFAGYTANGDQNDITFQKTVRSTTAGDVYNCEDQQGGVTGLIAVWEDAGTQNQRLCSETWLVDNGNVMLSRESAKMTSTDRLNVNLCLANLLGPRSTDVIDVALEKPVASSGNCPFPPTSYKVVVNERNGVTNKCAKQNAVATVAARTVSFTGNCYTGTTYQLPFQSSLQCISSFASSELDGQLNSGRGDVVILSVVDNGVTRYYCARYSIDGINVRLSFDTSSPDALKCDAAADYDDYSDTRRAVTLTSNLCAAGPCQNGGTCTDLMADYRCACVPGFTGNNCQTNINECASIPCFNGGVCNDGVNQWTCTCKAGYSGINCQIFNECVSSPCRNSGTCVDLQNDYLCRCVAGWTGKNCDVPINECASAPCQNGGTCTDLLNAYSCACPAGFTGVNCQINENECISRPCQNGGTCLDRVNGYYCRCTPFYIGLHCEQLNECGNAPCKNGGQCIDDLGFPQCICLDGYIGELCERVNNPCDNIVCQNGGRCISTSSGTSCTCPNGYFGDFCEFRQACLSSPCRNGGNCINTASGGFTCQCINGWFGTTCTIPQDFCAPRPCMNGGRCTSLSTDYTCACNNGYTGKNCQNPPDYCAPPPCQNGGGCISLTSDYQCNCVNSYTGKNCQIPPDFCLSRPCQNGGQCLTATNGYTCSCINGYTGQHCEYAPVNDYCATFPCSNGASCYNYFTGYYCKCASGWSGTQCTVREPCIAKPCQNGGRCTSVAGGQSYQCECVGGYSGPTCATAPQANPCARRPCVRGSCSVQGTSYTCNCPSGWTGPTCNIEFAASNLCSSNLNPCLNDATCRVDDGVAECQCASGWQGARCDAPADTQTGLSLTAIILIVVISVLVLAVVAVVLALALRRRNAGKGDDEASLARGSNGNPVITYTAGSGSQAWYPNYKNGNGGAGGNGVPN